ncbi:MULTISPECIES: DMT family transporter [Burkholderia]|nr:MULTISPECIES: multidrug efflux SMR transporter [Burkholderia]
MSPWILLSLSILSEVVGTVFLKCSDGLSRPSYTVAMGVCYVGAIWLMGIVTKQLEIGITYAIWAGAGTAITALVGVIVFDEGTSLAKLSGMAFIVAGVVLLNLSQRAAA